MTAIQAQDTTNGLSETRNDHNERHEPSAATPTPTPSPAKRTPLPKFQLFIVAMLQFAEPITATVIYPFINKFVRDTGVIQGDERKTGYYAGVITLPSAVFRKKKRITAVEQCATPDCTTSLLSGPNEQDYSATSTASTIESAESEDELRDLAPPPLLSLLTPPVQLTLLVYGFMTFSDMSLQVLRPLIYSTSISLGGLGFDPYRIGTIMGTWGVINAIFTLTCVPMLLRKFGARKIQIFTHFSYVSTLALYPILSYLVRRASGADALVWAVMVIQLTFALTTSASYGK
ncbi:hypothetical protein C0989_002966 [Termitomyces sp. Mn162]|nr:hypothetical protein C0989_002966 [Termitomyces sp. Mn162]